MERDSACEVIQENIAIFSQLALIKCPTDGDLEYFFGYGQGRIFGGGREGATVPP